jgi:hypothetical protein
MSMLSIGSDSKPKVTLPSLSQKEEIGNLIWSVESFQEVSIFQGVD